MSLMKTQKGTSLIEVMVSLFLLAIGLLGILALQNSSHKSNQSAMFSSEAAMYADDMVNRILVSDNPLIDTDDTAYNNIDTNSLGADVVPNCSSGCSASQILNRDRITWSKAIRAGLPGGRGQVSHDASTYTVTVMWDDQLTGANGTNCGGNPKVDLRCMTFKFQL